MHHIKYAMEELHTGLKIDADDASAYYYLGLCYDYNNNKKQALKEMRQALKKDPYLKKAKDYMALTYFNRTPFRNREELLFYQYVLPPLEDMPQILLNLNKALTVDADMPQAKYWLEQLSQKQICQALTHAETPSILQKRVIEICLKETTPLGKKMNEWGLYLGDSPLQILKNYHAEHTQAVNADPVVAPTTTTTTTTAQITTALSNPQNTSLQKQDKGKDRDKEDEHTNEEENVFSAYLFSLKLQARIYLHTLNTENLENNMQELTDLSISTQKRRS